MNVEVEPAPILCFVCEEQIVNLKSKVRITRNSFFTNFVIDNTGKEFVDNQYLCKKCYSFAHHSIKRIPRGRQRHEVGGSLSTYLTTKSESACIVCGSKLKRSKIPKEAIGQAFMEMDISIFKNSRCCPGHLINSRFSQQALDQIKRNGEEQLLTPESYKQKCKESCMLMFAPKQSMLCFEPGSPLRSPERCKIFLGISDIEFDDLFNQVKSFITGNSDSKKRRNLAIFLCKLRLGENGLVLGNFFGCSPGHIYKIFESVADSLYRKYAPIHVGFQHISHAEFKEHHSTVLCDQLFEVADDEVAVFVDATYLYCQKSSNQELQKKTFSPHKGVNLVKPTTFCAPDGYILSMSDVFAANAANNDAKILQAMTRDNKGIHAFAEGKGVILGVDRGYRDVREHCHNIGFRTKMPEYLPKNQKQHSCLEANRSRGVTKLRWIVEAAHGRLKSKFKFFRGVFSNKYLPIINQLWQVCAAISNNFFPPIAVDKENHYEIAQSMLRLMNSENVVETIVNNEGLRRRSRQMTKIDEYNFDEFPILDKEDLELLTFGVYQLRLCPGYFAINQSEQGGYDIFVYAEKSNLIRMDMMSRFSSSTVHKLWIMFQPNQNHARAIEGYYCTCRSGARRVGACSHVATILWFVGYARHLAEVPEPAKHLGNDISDAATLYYSDEESDNDVSSDEYEARDEDANESSDENDSESEN